MKEKYWRILRLGNAIYLVALFVYAIKLQVGVMLQLDNPMKADLYIALNFFVLTLLCVAMLMSKPKGKPAGGPDK